MDNIKDEFLNKVFTNEKIDEKTKEFYRKDWYNTVIKLKDNEYFAIPKPTIQTSFCFGYGLYGRASESEIKDAGEQAERARTSQERFIKENLRPIDNALATLKYHLIKLDNFNKAQEYYNKNEKIIRYIDTTYVPVIYSCRNERPFELSLEYTDRENATTNKFVKRIATKDDLEKIIKAHEQVKEQFTKRLNTYLKRFGLKKLNVWTYLVD